MNLRQRYFVACLVVIWFGTIWGCLVPCLFAQNSEEEKPAVISEAAPNPDLTIDELQRAEALKHIPELIVFLALTLTLAFFLRSKACDFEKLREERFFQGETPNGGKS